MNDQYKAMFEVSKACTTVRLTASGKVSSKPCFVFFISFCPEDGAALYEASIHNGETAAAEVLLDGESQYGQSKYHGCVPMYFNKGIYYAHTTNMKSCTIQYFEVPKK